MESRTAVITGTGRSLPSTVVTNHDLEKRVDTSDEWIRTRTGIRERRIASEGEGVSVYAGEAGRLALEAAGVAPEDVGMVILATVTVGVTVQVVVVDLHIARLLKVQAIREDDRNVRARVEFRVVV